MSRPELASFRKLLRLCRHFDREPTWQLGLVGRPPWKYDWYQHRVRRRPWGILTLCPKGLSQK